MEKINTTIDATDISVNGKTIQASAIDTEIQYHPSKTRREAMIKAAETLIIGELLVQKAVEKGLLEDTNSDIINTRQDSIDALLDAEVDIPKASNEECQRYFEANQEKFITPPLIEANHILLAADPKDIELRGQMQVLAKKLIDALKDDPKQFVSLASQHSACSSKDLGGSLGQISYGQTVSEFERQVFAAGTGLMTTPVESRFGYHIVDIKRKIEGKPLSFDMVREKIQKYLNDKVQRKSVAQYLNRIVSEADIKGYQFNIDTSSIMQ